MQSHLIGEKPISPKAFEAYKFLFNHLLDYAATEQFNEWTPEYRREYLHEFRQFGDLITSEQCNCQDATSIVRRSNCLVTRIGKEEQTKSNPNL